MISKRHKKEECNQVTAKSHKNNLGKSMFIACEQLHP